MVKKDIPPDFRGVSVVFCSMVAQFSRCGGLFSREDMCFLLLASKSGTELGSIEVNGKKGYFTGL